MGEQSQPEDDRFQVVGNPFDENGMFDDRILHDSKSSPKSRNSGMESPVINKTGSNENLDQRR
jgi:hypothetical protein